jgi:hypothetical protein
MYQGGIAHNTTIAAPSVARPDFPVAAGCVAFHRRLTIGLRQVGQDTLISRPLRQAFAAPE